MKQRYDDYSNTEMITVPKKRLYTDSCGCLNENAFQDFVSQLDEAENYYLICLIVDITECNKKYGFAFGTRLLRQVYLQLNEYFYVFRINGNKFNMIVAEKDLPNAEKMLNSNTNGVFSIYYAVLKDMTVTEENISEVRKQCVEMMYSDKARKTKKKYSEVRDDKIIGNKGNTPAELQETATCKYIETMWFGTIHIEETSPQIRSVRAYIFPTEFKENLASLNLVAAVDDFVNTRIYSGTCIEFGLDGMKFMISARFDREGHLNISCFKDRESKGNCDIKIDSHEGNCIPANFGKRIGHGLEIYPFRQNSYNTFDYILWNKEEKKAVLDTTGAVTVKGIDYTVFRDDKAINLLKQ